MKSSTKTIALTAVVLSLSSMGAIDAKTTGNHQDRQSLVARGEEHAPVNRAPGGDLGRKPNENLQRDNPMNRDNLRRNDLNRDTYRERTNIVPIETDEEVLAPIDLNDGIPAPDVEINIPPANPPPPAPSPYEAPENDYDD